MKKMIALLLALSICLLCAACGGNTTPDTTAAPQAESTAPNAASPTDAPAPGTDDAETQGESEAPGETTGEAGPALYTNPLTGEPMSEPITSRPVVVSISNVQDALPHRGVYGADILFESFVNGSIVRCLAIYSDITGIDSIGSVRSARPIFVDIAKHYNAFFAHAGGSQYTNKLLPTVDNMNVDTAKDSEYSYRDMDRDKASSWEHCLFIRGTQLMDFIVNKKGVNMAQDAGKDFGLRFVEDGTPADGSAANSISITLKYSSHVKETVMNYNADTGLYEFNQYGKTMVDEATGEAESFTNVIVMYTKMSYKEGYHHADFVAGGNGYFACGGKIIPIRWKCAGEDQPFTFYTQDGEVLNMGIGRTYIALTVDGAPVTCE